MAGPDAERSSEVRATSGRGTADRGTAGRDVVVDTGLGAATVVAVVRDKPPARFYGRLARWVPDAVRNEIETLEEVGAFERAKLLGMPHGRFLKRYPDADGAVVVWIGIAHNVELHTYREFPETLEFYLDHTRGDEETAKLLHETYTRFNRDLWHFVHDLGMRPDFARGRLYHINDQVFRLLLEMAGMLLNQGASLGAVRATSKKLIDTRKQTDRGRSASKGEKARPKGINGSSRRGFSADEETLLRKALSDRDYAEHLEALERIRKLHRALDGLTDAEIVAIRAYSHNTADRINRAMRHGGVTPEIRLLIDRIESGLQKLPPVKGTLDRGIAISPKDASELFVEGTRYIDKAFQSATSGNIPKSSTILLTIKAIGKSGRDISKVAAHDEKEVLFLPRSPFRVERVKRDSGGQIRHVEVTEL